MASLPLRKSTLKITFHRPTIEPRDSTDSRETRPRVARIRFKRATFARSKHRFLPCPSCRVYCVAFVSIRLADPLGIESYSSVFLFLSSPFQFFSFHDRESIGTFVEKNFPRTIYLSDLPIRTPRHRESLRTCTSHFT